MNKSSYQHCPIVGHHWLYELFLYDSPIEGRLKATIVKNKSKLQKFSFMKRIKDEEATHRFHIKGNINRKIISYIFEQFIADI